MKKLNLKLVEYIDTIAAMSCDCIARIVTPETYLANLKGYISLIENILDREKESK